MVDLVDTGEMYLKTIFELEEEKIEPLRARIVERLGHSGPTVSETVGRLERDKWVAVARNRRLRLSNRGWRLAADVMRKHRLAERLLIDIVGLSWHLAHDEACRWEHVMSDEAEDRLIDILNRPKLDPYGNPIPYEREGLGVRNVPSTVGDLPHLDEDDMVDRPLRVIRFGEPAQADPELLKSFMQIGLLPGATISVSDVRAAVRGSAYTRAFVGERTVSVQSIDGVEMPGNYTMSADEVGTINLSDNVSRHIYVEPVDE